MDTEGIDATNVAAPAAIYQDVAEVHYRDARRPDADRVFGSADAQRDPSGNTSVLYEQRS
jgi:hypothetical protein